MLTEAAVGSAREWLYPGGAGAKYESLLREHRASDHLTLQRLSSDEAGVWLALKQALDSRPELQRDVVGCGGVHFLNTAPPSSVGAIGRAISGNVAEVCALAGVHAEWDVQLRRGEMLAFPLSGLSVRHSDGRRLVINVSPAGVQLRYDDGVVVPLDLGHGPSDGRLLRPRLSGASTAEELLFDFGGVRLTRGGLPALLKPPPGFAYTTEPPDAADAELLATCLKLLQRHRPELLSEMQALPTWVVLLQRGEHRLSFTADELPGVLYANLVDPLETLDLIVHEFHHAKLDLIESYQPLLTKPRTPAVAPWRPDIRTARGVIHGAYVFMNVAHVFEPLFRAGTASAQGRRRRVVWREAVVRACQELRSVECGLTDFGRDLVDAMHDDAEKWLREAVGYEVERSWARDQVQRHDREVRAGHSPEPAYMTGVDVSNP
jgi:HEXXH motif-containing protein